ncbi:cysteine proteinase [Clavulina sp. PMI_390]|nr:cysteine proteinase [Clavulina sp. PMI_390]
MPRSAKKAALLVDTPAKRPEPPAESVQGFAKTAKAKQAAKDVSGAKFPKHKQQAGIFVSAELEAAYERVKTKVQEIAEECRARNVRFRDNEFDLEEDKPRCLHSLDTDEGEKATPSDVRRVTQIYKKPEFFIDGANEGDIVQGRLGDCWFLSGAATVACRDDLIEKVCVARDEQVGVYGFIFMRDGIWKDVIIDDLLYTSIPQFEQLTARERNLYHLDRDKYNRTARMGGKSLYFAKSGTENETWVPLIEKAFAKFHGDYASLDGGQPAECIEDLTGGVSTSMHVKDILDTDRFWTEELLRADEDRLFTCSIDEVPEATVATVNGLMRGHAYSVISAAEVRGKRFVRVRNPWGDSEWNGRWSDGSKEWTSEWLPALEELKHKFGDDGAFVMTYDDFLDVWTTIDRVRLFDSNWVMSSLWVNATMRAVGTAWDYGDVSFTFSMPTASKAVIVLAQLDTRFFNEVSGSSQYQLDFKVFKRGEKKIVVNSSSSVLFGRSVNAEVDLEEGEYVVHVRADRNRFRPSNYVSESTSAGKWNLRKLGAVLTRGAESLSIVSNFNADQYDNLLRRPLDTFAGRDLHEIEVEAHERSAMERKKPVTPGAPPASGEEEEEEEEAEVEAETEDAAENVVDADAADEGTKAEANEGEESEAEGEGEGEAEAEAEEEEEEEEEAEGPPAVHEGVACDGCGTNPIVGIRYKCMEATCPNFDFCPNCYAGGVSYKTHLPTHNMLAIVTPADASNVDSGYSGGDDDELALGLRVYTNKDCQTEIKAQLRHGKVIRWRNDAA